MKTELIQHITFTGIDQYTDIARLRKLQKRFPLAEFGVLLSTDWTKNGTRFPDPVLLKELVGQGLHLSAHLCGEAATLALDGYWSWVDRNIFGSAKIRKAFRRIQLNVSTRKNLPERLAATLPHTEIIIQQKDADHAGLFLRSAAIMPDVSVLLDASGGRGVEYPFEVRPEMKAFKVGYAGGLGPENAADRLAELLRNSNIGRFWIDMESRVRTDDRFDLDKVEAVLKECYKILKHN